MLAGALWLSLEEWQSGCPGGIHLEKPLTGNPGSGVLPEGPRWGNPSSSAIRKIAVNA